MNKLLKLTAMTGLLLSALSTSAMASSDQREADMANGAQVWADVCMRCHNLRAPGDLSKRAWQYSMQHMRVRAGLTADETEDILAFILSSKTAEDRKN